MDPTRINAPAGRTTESLDQELPPPEGAYLVLAGPGTGKTTLLVQRARQLLETGALGKSKVLALTFTNKAAAEMKARLTSEFPDAEARAFIGTFQEGRAERSMEALRKLSALRVRVQHQRDGRGVLVVPLLVLVAAFQPSGRACEDHFRHRIPS